MDKTMLPGLKNKLVRFCPEDRELLRMEDLGLPSGDVVFRVEEASEQGLFLRDVDGSAGFQLAPNQIRGYLSDNKPYGIDAGLLRLKAHWCLRGPWAGLSRRLVRAHR
jgi:hypothetical protein